MSKRTIVIIAIVIASVFSLLLLILNDIRNTYVELGSIKTELKTVKQELISYKELVTKVNDIDNKFTRELADEKAKNNELYNNVINGLGRLQLNIDKTSSTTASVADANTCELTGEARQNYYLLRDDIITKDKMILGLQEYVREVCLHER